MKKYFTHKENGIEKEDIKENVFDLLDKKDLLNINAEFNKFYEVSVNNNEIIKELSLKDFINNGVEFLKKEIKDKNESGDFARIGSSENYARIGSSGDFARIGSSGDSAQIGLSGDYAQIGSSGYSAQIGLSGKYEQIGSSGNYAQIGSSGDSAQIGSSGYYARIGSSGYSARIGSSGGYAQIGSSGYYARIGSSGYYARIEINGNNSIGFACGYKSILKGKKGTWLSLAEWEHDNENDLIPCFAKSAQIGNKNYKDCFGKVLEENTFYQLVNKKFTPVIDVDGDRMVILNSRKSEETIIYKTQYLNDFINKEATTQYVVQKGEFTAHGESIKEAMSDVEFKYLQSQDVQEHIKRVKEQGYVTANDYRLLTGACKYGTNRWLEENGLTWEDKKSIEEVVKLTKGQYGHKRFVKLFLGKDS